LLENVSILVLVEGTLQLNAMASALVI